MSLEVQIHEVDQHVSIKAVGPYSLANLRDLFNRVKEERDHRVGGGVILDLTEVDGSIPVLDMLVLGEHCSRFWKQSFKIAIISPTGGLNEFFENVARNRGVQIAVVGNRNAGMEWLN